MSNIPSKIQTYLSSDRMFKWLVFKSIFFLGIGRFVVLVISFKKIASWMGKANQQTEIILLEKHSGYLNTLGKAIRAISPYTPWKSNCFAQALCAHWLLKFKSIEHTIYFGVKIGSEKKMEAHAWLRAGDQIITGGSGHLEFNVVGTFACHTKSLRAESYTML